MGVSRINGSCQAGHTLLELLVVLAIVAVLAVMMAPFLTSSLQDNRLTSQINQLHGSLQFARVEAIKRGTAITVCASTDGALCGGNWQDGWIVLAGTTLIRSSPALTGNNTLKFQLTTGGTSANVRFNARGFSPDHAGTWTLCDSRAAAAAKGLLLSATGRPLRATDTNGNGTPEDHNGADLTCP
ncbi:MAG: GspH/FimT family pseudopilin [Magnetococcales bacterium]|nr:GspH/FimT family pseudopilin [Magnetococcales bacterium]